MNDAKICLRSQLGHSMIALPACLHLGNPLAFWCGKKIRDHLQKMAKNADQRQAGSTVLLNTSGYEMQSTRCSGSLFSVRIWNEISWLRESGAVGRGGIGYESWNVKSEAANEY